NRFLPALLSLLKVIHDRDRPKTSVHGRSIKDRHATLSISEQCNLPLFERESRDHVVAQRQNLLRFHAHERPAHNESQSVENHTTIERPGQNSPLSKGVITLPFDRYGQAHSEPTLQQGFKPTCGPSLGKASELFPRFARVRHGN